MNLPGYVRQIDGLRFVAAFLVMLQHWLVNPTSLPVPAGLSGVTLFFVISGFLITNILLGSRERIEAKGASQWRELKVFYIRRCLRIFPLYYAVVLALLLIGVQSARDSAAWLLTYTINWKFALIGGYEPVISHFWSLAIEEQFYLIYPLMLLFWPARKTPQVVAGFIAVGVLSRVAGLALGLSDRSNTFITFTCFDALGAGAALAHVHRYRPEWFRRALQPRVLLALLLVLFAGTIAWLRLGDEGSYRVIWLRLLIALISAWFVGRAVVGFGGPLGAGLAHPVIVYLGRISYGLYVYHNLVGHAVDRFAGPALPLAPRFALCFALTVAVSIASWHLFEWPINRLKERHPYA